MNTAERRQELRRRFAPQAVERAGCWLLKPATAIEFIRELESNGIALNGIEGYWLTESTIQPSMEHSIYFLGGADIRLPSITGNTVTEKALNFIRAKAELGLMFDLDFEDA